MYTQAILDSYIKGLTTCPECRVTTKNEKINGIYQCDCCGFEFKDGPLPICSGCKNTVFNCACGRVPQELMEV